MTHSRTPDAASADLKKIGLKATLPRLKILRILEEAKVRHMTAEDVYKILLAAGEEVGLATVYRVLTQFEGAGLVIRHNFEGRARYSRLIKEATMTTWCASSAARFSSSKDIAIEERQLKVASIAGFVVEDHSLYLYGVCQGMRKHGKCSKK